MVVNKSLCHNSRVSADGSAPAWRAIGALCLTCAIVVVAAGCYWLRYHDLVETHCELLEDLSVATLAQVEASPPRISPGDVERLRYPLERAREFLVIAGKRFAGRGSLAELAAMVDTYAELIDELEAMRVGMTDGAKIPPVIGQIRQHAARVRAAVRAEQGR